ncbi:MAG: MBL fold metallo-hydrolase [Deferrisomatales bacterium]
MFFRQIEVGQHAVFAYLIGDPAAGEAVVVDPADEVDRLIEAAAAHGMRIRTIVNTHGHVDHVMGNAEMQEKTGASIAIHEAEADYLLRIGEFWLQMFQARRSPPADRMLRDGDVLEVGAYRWRVIHTPGHTPGGICLYYEPQGLCLTGDTLFVGSVGRTDGPKASFAELSRSIRERLFPLPPDTEIFPGHNYGVYPTSTVARERAFNPFVNDAYDFDLG